MTERFSRQSFLGKESDQILANSRACIIGLGGGGSHIAQQLAHIGIGNFLVYDADRVEDSNLNRLVGASAKDAHGRTLKTAVAHRLIKRVNPGARIVRVSKQWQEDALPIRDCDIVFGCVDTYSAREQIERTCRRFLIPYIDIGMDVTECSTGYVISGQVILSMPGELCMRCLGFMNDKLLVEEAARYGAAGGRPQVIWPNGILASIAVGTFVQLVTPWHSDHHPVIYLEYDGNTQTVLPSNRLKYVTGKRCQHFSSATDLGDPFWPPPSKQE
jgi:molybdopterin/thiamine biosynthesis adenylyltransferase